MKWLAVIVGVLILAAVLWDAGERHYRNCVEVARSLPDPANVRAQIQKELQSIVGSQSRAADLHADALRGRIKGCSRLPF